MLRLLVVVLISVCVALVGGANTTDCVGQEDGNYRNYENPNSFITCSNGHKYIMKCPPTLHYDFQTDKCNHVHFAQDCPMGYQWSHHPDGWQCVKHHPRYCTSQTACDPSGTCCFSYLCEKCGSCGGQNECRSDECCADLNILPIIGHRGTCTKVPKLEEKCSRNKKSCPCSGDQKCLASPFDPLTRTCQSPVGTACRSNSACGSDKCCYIMSIGSAGTCRKIPGEGELCGSKALKCQGCQPGLECGLLDICVKANTTKA